MIIESLYIRAFGGLRDYSLTLTEGMNIIEGANESGKTTLAAFIVYCLYGFDKTEKSLRTGWDGKPCGGSIQLSHEGKRLRIERESGSKSDSTAIYDTSTNEKIYFEQSPGEQLLGIPKELFLRTAYVGQASGSAFDGKSVSGAVENLLFSADEAINTEKALKRLDDARVVLQHKNGKGGRIPELAGEIDSLRARLTASSANNAKIIESESQLARTKQSIEKKSALRGELQTRTAYLESAALLEQFDSFNAIKSKGIELNSDYKLLRESAEFEGFTPDRDYLKRLRDLNGERGLLKSELDAANGEYTLLLSSEPDLDGLERVSDTVENLGGQHKVAALASSARRGYHILRVFGFICAALAVVSALAAAYFILFSDKLSLTYLSAGGFALFTVLAIVLLFSAVKPEQRLRGLFDELNVTDRRELNHLLEGHETTRERLETLEDKLEANEKKRAELEQKYHKCVSELEEMLEKWNKTDAAEAVEAAEKYCERSEKLRAELETQFATYNSYKKQLENQDEAVLREKFPALRESYEALPPASDTGLPALKKELEFTVKALESLTERRAELEKTLAELYAVTVRPAPLAERITTLEKELFEAKKRCDAIMTAYDALQRASEKLRGGISPKLSADAGVLMNEATNGRYRDISVDTDMSMTYSLPDEGNAHSIGFMSAGTADLAYISLRIALSKLICNDGKPPLIFDESFARLDDRRLANVMRILAAYSLEGGQTIILTSQKRDALLMKDAAPFNHIVLQPPQ